MAKHASERVSGRSCRAQSLLEPGQVGLLHTRRKRERNGKPVLVKAVGREGAVFRVPTRAASGPLFEDVYVSWKRFDFVFSPVPPEACCTGEALLILRLLGLGTHAAAKVRCDVGDQYEVRLLKRFMRIAPALAKAFLAETLDQEVFAQVTPGSQAGNSTLTRMTKTALYTVPDSKAGKKRLRALLMALAKKQRFQQAYDAWLLNPDQVSFKQAKRLVHTFAEGRVAHELYGWKTGPGFAVHWTAALLEELLRRHLANGPNGGIHGFAELVVGRLKDGGVTQEAWLNGFPNARRLAKAFGVGRAKFWRLYVGN